MILVGDILADEKAITAKFSCDTAKCKGACCTLEGGGGAPLTDDEAEIIRGIYEAVSPYLSECSGDIARNSPVEGTAGDYSTTCIDSRACCFVYFDTGGVARCSIERAYFEGKTSFRKPLSCHLFPLRIGNFGGSYVFYEHFDECEPGREKGRLSNIYLLNELQEPLRRAFGEKWTEELNNKAAAMRAEKNNWPDKDGDTRR
ncbi:DUF3109 family protein [Ignavibacteria bacterium]|nr:DUF3109 family protein [Bacteroidota bacterium]MCZ2133276.1 DUF3109 family protein [Bacteroidota bacterium]